MKGSMPGDPSSPTRMEAGNLQGGGMPIPPSTPSSGSRQRGNGYNGGQGAPLGSSPQQAAYGSGLVGGCGGCPNLSGQDLRYLAGNLAQSQMQFQNVSQTPFQNMMQQSFQPGLQNSGGNMMFGTGFSQGSAVPVGPGLGGMTPQANRMHQMFEMSKGLSASQLMTVVQGLQEQLKSQGRENPDVFGQRPSEDSGGKGSVGVPQLSFGLDAGADMKHVDVFSKSEKWLGTPPVPSVASWTSRDTEVIGWATYVSSLSAWAAQASMDFSIEIQQASRWPSSIIWETLQPQKQARALRLHAILKAAFNEHPRTNNLISAFGEGVKLIDNDGSGLNPSQIGNGYELLRQLTCEYSLRNRGEALALRTVFLNKSFSLSSAETSPSSIVSDLTRRLDLESARYSKLLGTLPSHVDTVGLQLTDADLLLVLMKSLPEAVKSYTIHHSTGDSYASYRQAACKWESQQRMFLEQAPQGKSGKVHEVSFSPMSNGSAGEFGAQSTEWYSIADDSMMIDAVGQNKCAKCGSKKHATSECQTDVSKLTCFRCSEKGHISANCPKKASGKGGKPSEPQFGKGSKGKPGKGVKGKFDSKGKGKKGKSFGKKGKLNELGSDGWSAEDYWWWADDGWWSGYDVNQVNEDWNTYDSWQAHDWYSDGWQDDAGMGQAKAEQGSSEPQTEPPIGSLVISMVSGEDFGDVCRFDMLVDNDVRLQLALEESGDECLDLDRLGSCERFPGLLPVIGFGLSERLCFPRACRLFCDPCDIPRPIPLLKLFARISDVPEVLRVHGERLQLLEPLHSFPLSREGCHDYDEKSFHEGLIAPSAMRVKMFVTNSRTFLNNVSETSHVAECRKYSSVFAPLLSQIGLMDDCTWWLLDSGASVTVLSKSSFVTYAAEWSGDPGELDRFSAANGSSVNMLGKASVSVFLCLWDRSKDVDVWKKARLSTLVGETRHNILSTTTLCKSGWVFKQDVHGAALVHESSGLHAHEVTTFAGCPWIRLHPHSGLDTRHDECTLSGVDMIERGVVNPLSRAAQSELEQHRAQGHTPHNPNCLECGRGRSTFMHRRRKDNLIETEVQADFCFLSQNGELSDLEAGGAVKILVLTELVSNCVAYIVVTENETNVRREIVAWLNHFGLESEKSSIVLHTDAEASVRSLVTGCSTRFVFHVRKARPQQHQSVGAAERGVRRLKESLTILRADLNGNGVDLKFGVDGLSDAFKYLALVHNHFGKSRETDYSPLELAVGRRLAKPVTTMFGAVVLAELPDSLRAHSPNESRYIEASYIHCGIDKGPIVSGKIRIDGELELCRFVARNVRVVTPLAWKLELCDDLLIGFGGDAVDGDRAVGDRPRDVVVAPPDSPPARRDVVESAPDAVDVPPPPAPHPALPGLRLARKSRPQQAWQDDPDERRKLKSQTVKIFQGRHVDVGEKKRVEKGNDGTGNHDEDNTEAPTKKVRFSENENEPNVTENPVPPSPVTPGQATDSSDVGGRVFTRHCPACETGMEAPGIRHNARCRRANSPMQVADDSNDVDMPEIPQEVEFRERTKRSAETAVEDLEEEIRQERIEMLSELVSDSELGLCWIEDMSPVLNSIEMNECCFTPLTCPDMFDFSVSSIRFESHDRHESVQVALGGGNVLIWKPDEAIDDSTLALVDCDLCFDGMREEVCNLEVCKTGTLLDIAQVEAIRRLKPHTRVIASRWVVARKSDTRVRARIVAKDIARGPTAKQLGYSSPTPSVEGLSMVLSVTSEHDMRIRGLDVSHAFMHSPLGNESVVLKMPLSVSMLDGSVAYLNLDKALNGLRDASLRWLCLLSDTIKKVGVWSDNLEPCIYQGSVSLRGKVLGLVCLVVYVDDILLGSSCVDAEQVVVDAISSVVPTKTTGLVMPSQEGGGSLTFIGRTISRRPGEKALWLSVDPDYLKPCFSDYGVKKGSSAAPDVASFLEKTDEQSTKQLSSEGYQVFRKCLGKLLWLAQTRHDVKTWLSLVGSVQACPTVAADQALKSILRFLFDDRYVQLRLPSESLELTCQDDRVMTQLNVWSDASHAPYRFNKRKGMTGIVITYMNSLIKTASKTQQAVSLSSCESELYAIQLSAQEAVGFSKFTWRLLFGLGMIDEQCAIDLQIESDSQSAIQLLQGIELPKRSRHIEVRVEWLKAKLADGSLRIRYRSGETNVADLFTKCLGTKTFMKHRTVLGFAIPDQPVGELNCLADDSWISAVMATPSARFAMVEVCCLPESSLRISCEKLGYPYLGVSANMEDERVLSKFVAWVRNARREGLWIHVHVSTPCTLGSPLRNFGGEKDDTDLHEEWRRIMGQAGNYLKRGDTKSFELPSHNRIWKFDETQQVLHENGLNFFADVLLCQTGVCGRNGLPVSKTLRFFSTSHAFCSYLVKRFGKCSCEKHASLTEAIFKKTGNYTLRLAKSLIHAVILARRDP